MRTGEPRLIPGWDCRAMEILGNPEFRAVNGKPGDDSLIAAIVSRRLIGLLDDAVR